MRIVTQDAENWINSLVGTVRKDRDSWKEWHAMRIEMLSQGPNVHWNGLQASIKRLIEIYLQGKHGTAYLCGHAEVHVFCRDIPPALLDTMGRQIVDLVHNAAGIAAIYRVYSLYEETEAFLHAYEAPRPATVQESGIDLQCELPFLPAPEDPRTDSLSRLNGRSVLLVEDDPVTRWMVKMALKDECRLSVVSDANKALAAYNTHRPDMVLLDINLPGQDGRELMARIFRSDPGAHVVMFSANDSLETMVETIESGAKAFIAKPFDKERLLQCVNNCPSGH